MGTGERVEAQGSTVEINSLGFGKQHDDAPHYPAFFCSKQEFALHIPGYLAVEGQERFDIFFRARGEPVTFGGFQVDFIPTLERSTIAAPKAHLKYLAGFSKGPFRPVAIPLRHRLIPPMQINAHSPFRLDAFFAGSEAGTIVEHDILVVDFIEGEVVAQRKDRGGKLLTQGFCKLLEKLSCLRGLHWGKRNIRQLPERHP